MNNDNLRPASPAEQSHKLRGIAGELTEVHKLLSALCHELGGGGIVQARHLQPMLASAVPKLDHAVRTMHELTEDSGDDSKPPNPRLV